MFNQEEPQGTYPANEEEKETLIANVIKLIHKKETSQALLKSMQGGQDPVEVVAKLSAMITYRVIDSLEKESRRDIPPKTELGVLQMSVEELYTVATNAGAQVDAEMVANSIEIGAAMFNDLQEGAGQQQQQQAPPQQPSAMQGPPPPQGGMM